MDMRIYKAMVMTTGGVARVDVIHHEGKFWLVPFWLEYSEVQVSLPMLAIPLDEWPHDKLREGTKGMQFVVNGPLPKALFQEDADEAPEAQRYVELVVDDMRRRRPHQMT